MYKNQDFAETSTQFMLKIVCIQYANLQLVCTFSFEKYQKEYY